MFSETLAAFFGILAGITLSILANWLSGPFLDMATGFRFIYALACMRRFISTSEFDQHWTQSWSLSSDSENFPSSNEGPLDLYYMGGRLAARWTSIDKHGNRVEYRAVGQIKDGLITGRWFDSNANDYYGPLQLVLSHRRTLAKGRWLGFGQDKSVSNQSIKGGEMLWSSQELTPSVSGRDLKAVTS